MPRWDAHVDESGSRLDASGGQGRFVLVCMAGSPAAISGLVEKIRRLKLELVPGADPANWELHAGDMFHDRGGSPPGSLTTEEKMSIMRRIVAIVCDGDIALFGISIMRQGAGRRGATDARTAERATAILVERLEWLAGAHGGEVTLRVVSDNVRERRRLAMSRALEQRAAGRGPPRGTARAVTGIEFVDSRSSAADAAFGGMFGDTRQKARADGNRGRLRRVGTAGRVIPVPPPLGWLRLLRPPWRAGRGVGVICLWGNPRRQGRPGLPPALSPPFGREADRLPQNRGWPDTGTPGCAGSVRRLRPKSCPPAWRGRCPTNGYTGIPRQARP